MELVWEDGQLLIRGPSGSTTPWTPFSSICSLAHAESTKFQKATPFPSLNQEESCHLALIGKLPTWNMEEEKHLKNTSNKMNVMNFAHCLRPADLQRAHNLATSATKPSTIRDFSCTETVRDKYEVSAPHNSTLVKSTLLNSIHGPESIVSPKSQTRLPAAQEDLRSAPASWIQNSPFSDHQHKAATQIGASVDNKFHNQPPPKFSSPSAIAFKGKPRTERYVEPLGACSSVSSRGASNNPNYITTRNHQLNESEYENNDDEQVKYVKKTSGDRRCTTAKRYRDAEVHNPSEKRRRHMLDEKTRVLQKLIPNCTKVDTISVLDKAIEYLKTLQLELQIMSMANKIHMATMLHPTTHYLHAPLANCSAFGQFPNSPFVIGASALTSVDGSRLQMLRNSGQVPLMSVSHSPFVSLPRGPASFMGFMASHHSNFQRQI